ncbi:hypothetical protein [Nonomuraea sp. NPDC049709]|uniref:hypothetical protein n=1 Tax=Nonomuraea sp. NPDC049709 TaxID=3154736 RepID=UPI003432BA6D
MPKVRILTGVSGVDVNYVRGDVVELPGSTAASWVESGMAELVRGEEPETPETPETAAAPEPETASPRSRAGRARKSG